MPVTFDKKFSPRYGKPVRLHAEVTRITARNAHALTFAGTNSYLAGRETIAVIDPGPNDPAHFAALVAAIGKKPVSHVLLTHKHDDHAALASRVAEHFQAPVAAHADSPVKPHIPLHDGDSITVGSSVLTAITTPGHTPDHLVFALANTGILFSGDHVMGWSTTMIAPPDGSMKDYMASLDKLLARDEELYLSGHGGPLQQPAKFIRALKAHRKMRERAILQHIAAGDKKIDTIVHALYRGIAPQLYDAAALSVLAHIEYLVERGFVATTDTSPQLDSNYLLI